MAKWNSEQEARQEILDLIARYYHEYKEPESRYQPGGRICYAGRVYD